MSKTAKFNILLLFQFDYFDNFEVLKNFSFIIEFILNYKKAYDLILWKVFSSISGVFSLTFTS
jgi:hypothetical protein